MASYPSSVKSFTNPSSTSEMDDSGVFHDVQHAEANDEINAIETELGTTPKAPTLTAPTSSPASVSVLLGMLLYRLKEITGLTNWYDAFSASDARTALGLVIGTNVQAYNATLAAVAGGTYTGDDSITTVGTLASGNATAVVDASSTTAAGKVEIAIASEINTGTDATRAVSPDSLAGSNLGIRYVEVIVFDPTTDVATGDGKSYFHIPPGLNGMNLVYAHGMVTTAGTTNSTTVQIHNLTQTADMLTALIEVETGETGSDTSDPGVTIDTNNDDVATNDRIRIDIDTVSTTAPKGLVITLGFQLP